MNASGFEKWFSSSLKLHSRYTCQYIGNILDENWYFWNKTVSEHCCLHCDGTVYKADTIIDTVVEDDDCGTIKTSVCRKNDKGRYKSNRLLF